MMKKLHSEATLMKLQEAIVSLLLQKCYQEITIADITKSCGISRTTFYMFFSSKEELVRDLWAELIDAHVDRLKLMLTADKDEMHAELQLLMECNKRKKKAICALLRIHTGSFIPYLDLIDRFEKKVLETMPQGTTSYSLPLFAKYYATNSATTIALWAENNDESFTVSDICDIQYTCMYKGMASLLE